ncbi:vacuolar protein sorting-associated protein [Anaeramoeba ignava]|uniref:Vacuolar protein sorting-associated protein 11 homolog n=1 Tax=Anaeramoeba ignava TaxID=1746090 RepID=A0A9Q0LCI0_ANAIG|nr:vacuolar protein sorting-associated protein [Anaeramoeba ignava]
MLHWRRFQFFNKEIVQDPTTSKPTNLLKELSYTCCSSGKGRLVFGDSSGLIHFVNRQFQIYESFQAFKNNISNIYQLKQSNILISIGQDSETEHSPYLIKIFNLEQKNKKGVYPILKELKIYSGKYPNVKVSVLAVEENLTKIALGLENGAIVLIHGDILRDRFSKQKLIRNPNLDLVTNLIFLTNSTEIANQNEILYCATNQSIIAYTLIKGVAQENILDINGSKKDCTALSQNGNLIVGRDEAVFFFTPDGLGPCYGFSGEKTFIYQFKSYLLTITKGEKVNSIYFYDLKNKHIAFTTNMLTDCKYILSEWGDLYLITSDNSIVKLQEKTLPTKLEILFQKHLYNIAIDLANSQNYDPNAIADMFKKYGDHLYSKGDFEGAIDQYLHTIGKLEPSYVIMRFLEAQRIQNLTKYLQVLHQRGHAQSEHTTLLLNCYTKLKDLENLEKFIKGKSDHETDKKEGEKKAELQEEEPTFEIEPAIRALRNAGYYQLALYLAKKNSEHEICIQILVDDLKDAKKALEYIKTLDSKNSEKLIKDYGLPLVKNLPKETTELIIGLCSESIQAENDSHFFENDNSSHRESLTAVDPLSSGLSQQRTSDVMETILDNENDQENFWDLDAQKEKLFAKPKKIQENKPRQYDHQHSSKPEEFIHLFVEQPIYLVDFLETMISKRPDSSPLVYNTLLELYLSDDIIEDSQTISKEEQKKQNYDKALAILKSNQSNYDVEQALVLVQMHNFQEGIILLLEKKQLYNEIIQKYIANNEDEKLMRTCKQVSENDPNLWLKVLEYFCSKSEVEESKILDVLEEIEKQSLIPPLLVLQELTKNPKITVKIVKKYLIKQIESEIDVIEKDQNLIEKTEKKIKETKESYQILKTQPKIFQQTKCSICSNMLDLPLVHFLCGHSFHLRCLTENENYCPLCQDSMSQIDDMKNALIRSNVEHDEFDKLLKNSSDGFEVISGYVGRGLLTKYRNKKLIPTRNDYLNLKF